MACMVFVALCLLLNFEGINYKYQDPINQFLIFLLSFLTGSFDHLIFHNDYHYDIRTRNIVQILRRTSHNIFQRDMRSLNVLATELVRKVMGYLQGEELPVALTNTRLLRI